MLAQAPSHLQSLLRNKRLALWQEMLEYYEYPDKDLVRDIVQGFPLTGWLPDSNVFPKDYKPPSINVDTLRSLSVQASMSVSGLKCWVELPLNYWGRPGKKLKKNCKKGGWKSTTLVERTPHGQ